MLSRRAYRSKLWNDSIMSTHYRSIISNLLATTAPVGVNTIDMGIFGAFRIPPNTPFWKSGVGGLQDPSFGIVPDWANPSGAGIPEPTTIIIRGGRMFLTIANPSTTDTINVRAQLVYPKASLLNTTATANSNTLSDYITAIASGNPRPISWSAQAAPDYSQYFHKPVLDKTMDLKPGDDLMLMFKIRPCKLDVQPFLRGSGNFPFWFVYCGQRVDTTAGAQAMTLNVGHNISFCVMDTNDV